MRHSRSASPTIRHPHTSTQLTAPPKKTHTPGKCPYNMSEPEVRLLTGSRASSTCEERSAVPARARPAAGRRRWRRTRKGHFGYVRVEAVAGLGLRRPRHSALHLTL